MLILDKVLHCSKRQFLDLRNGYFMITTLNPCQKVPAILEALKNISCTLLSLSSQLTLRTKNYGLDIIQGNQVSRVSGKFFSSTQKWDVYYLTAYLRGHHEVEVRGREKQYSKYTNVAMSVFILRCVICFPWQNSVTKEPGETMSIVLFQSFFPKINRLYSTSEWKVNYSHFKRTVSTFSPKSSSLFILLNTIRN